jgi:16S rRNA (guanine(527)-N(7))-methyltransferase RsmG
MNEATSENGGAPLLTWPPDISAQCHQLLIHHAQLVRETGLHLNLMSAAQRPPEIVRPGVDPWWFRHIVDSCAPLLLGLEVPGVQLLDTGSGAGFPAVPLAIMKPDLEVTMAESISKKATFLTATVRQLGLANCTVCNRRAEELVREPARWHVISCRAVGPPQRVLPWVMPLLARGGTVWLWLSERQATDLSLRPQALQRRRWMLKSMRWYRLPEVERQWALAEVGHLAAQRA